MRETITDEDRALDAAIEAQLATPIEAPIMPKLDGYDGDPNEVITVDIPKGDHLKEHVEDYFPATNYYELEQQVEMAKDSGCDTIELSEEFFKKHFRKHYEAAKSGAGYIFYKDVKAHIEGMVEHAKHVNSRTTYSNESVKDK